jgi:hypothetical protein
LNARARELTAEVDASAKVAEKWKTQAARLKHEVEENRRELAGLRYAVLDASRMSAKLYRERVQQERQRLDSMRQLAAILAQTPLSLAQRKMLADLQGSMENHKAKRGTGTAVPAFPIEAPNFHSSEFSLAEITESACGAVRVAAEAAGVAVQVSTAGTDLGNVTGYAEHIHQLITLLTVSPLTMTTGIGAVSLEVSMKAAADRAAELNLRIALTTEEDTQALLDQITKVTSAASALQAALLNEAEFGLAAGWQLAAAMGARTTVEQQGAKEICLLLSLPLQLASEALADKDKASLRNGNNGHGTNGSNNGHHRLNGKDAVAVPA